MNRSTFCNPRLLLKGKEVQTVSDASFSDSGNNNLQKLSVTFTEPELEGINLFNEKIEFYLNYGSEDGSPLFRGYVKEFSASEDKVSISALDPRTFISGKDSLPVVIDDKNNYDGFSVIQYIADVLDNHLNVNKTILSTEALQEMDKPIFMTGVRQADPPYDILKSKVKTQRDSDDILKIYEY